MKHYTFTATETEEPYSRWALTAGIDEESLTSTLNNLCDHQVPLDRIDTYMLAISIIHRKAKDLLKARAAMGPFRFSPFETVKAEHEFGPPDYEAGGLAIWLLDSAG